MRVYAFHVQGTHLKVVLLLKTKILGIKSKAALH